MNAFAADMQRWVDLLTKLTHTDPASPAFHPMLQSLRESFASQLEVWLRSMHPFAAYFAVPPQPSTQFAPHGDGVGPRADSSRAASLLSDWIRLQSQLAVHWTTIARTAAETFMARTCELTASGKLPDAQKLFAVWIDCAEEAYSRTAHSQTFARLVSDFINTAVAIQLQGRRVRTRPKKIRGKPRVRGKRRR